MKKFRIVTLILILTAALMFASCDKKNTEELTTEELTTEPVKEIVSMQQSSYMAENQGIAVSSVCNVTGKFNEDGSSRDVTDVSGIIVCNNSEKSLQYAEIRETFPDGTVYTYKVSTVPPGESCRVAETAASSYRDLQHETPTWEFVNVAFFTEEPSAHDDMLKFSGAESILNVQNISGADIPDNIVIYYKDYEDGILASGITYRVTVEGGLAADAITQVMAKHYVPENSMIMFVEFISPEAE